MNDGRAGHGTARRIRRVVKTRDSRASCRSRRRRVRPVPGVGRDDCPRHGPRRAPRNLAETSGLVPPAAPRGGSGRAQRARRAVPAESSRAVPSRGVGRHGQVERPRRRPCRLNQGPPSARCTPLQPPLLKWRTSFRQVIRRAEMGHPGPGSASSARGTGRRGGAPGTGGGVSAPDLSAPDLSALDLSALISPGHAEEARQRGSSPHAAVLRSDMGMRSGRVPIRGVVGIRGGVPDPRWGRTFAAGRGGVRTGRSGGGGALDGCRGRGARPWSPFHGDGAGGSRVGSCYRAPVTRLVLIVALMAWTEQGCADTARVS